MSRLCPPLRTLMHVALVLSCLVPIARAQAFVTHWTLLDGTVRGGGSARILTPGILEIATNQSALTEVAIARAMGSRYIVSFRAQVVRFGSEQGTRIRDGAYRADLRFEPQGVVVRDEADHWVLAFAWDYDLRFHDYSLVVNQGRADLFVDSDYAFSFRLPRDAQKNSITHWVKGPELSALHIDHTRVEEGAGYSFEQAWNDLSGTAREGKGRIETANGELLLRAEDEGVTRAVSYRQVPTEYVAAFSARIGAFGSENGFAVYDGEFRAQLYFRPQGIVVRDADGGTTLLARFDEASSRASHRYVITTHRDYTQKKLRAKARLLMDGIFCGEWNLQRDKRSARIEHWVKGPMAASSAFAFTTVRAASADEHVFSDDFESDGQDQPPAWWMLTTPYDHGADSRWRVTKQEGQSFALTSDREPSSSLALLHVFAKNITRFSGTFSIKESGEQGTIWFNVRRNHEESRIVVRLAIDSGRLELIEREAKNLPVRVLATHKTSALSPGPHKFGIATFGPFVTFALDGQTVLTSAEAKHQTYGRIGFETKDARVAFDDVLYEGDGAVSRGVLEGVRVPRGEATPVESASTGLMRRADGSLWLTNTEGRCFISADQGATFRYEPAIGCGTNLIERAVTRELVRIVTDPHPSGEDRMLFVEASASGRACTPLAPLDATCWGQQRTALAEQRTGKLMPGKVTQTSTGRVFVAVPEPTQEGIGGMRVFYSDDLANFVPAQRAHDMATLGIDVEAGKVVEVGDGSLKLFMRSNLGALLESTSYDGGATWGEVMRTVFRSPRADFNIERDPKSGLHFMVWQHDDPDECRGTMPDGTWKPIPSRCRARLSLAVSRDGMRTWRFLLTVDDWDGHPFRHMNTSLYVYDQVVWIASARRSFNSRDFLPDVTDLALFRVDTRLVDERVLFPGTH